VTTSAAPPQLATLDLDPAQYPGGIGIWGSLPAIYDTTQGVPEHGVHVHARKVAGRQKDIDQSYGLVNVALRSGVVVPIREVDATPYVAAAVLGLPVTEIVCPYCARSHLDEERFGVHPHQRHQCQSCGREFLESTRAIGNPIMRAKRELGDALLTRPTVPGRGPLRIDQSQKYFGGGMLIWGSNPAIVWTAQRNEESGVHVHVFDGQNSSPTVDDTYDIVDVDGLRLEASMVRVFMVQQSFAHLRGLLSHVRCSACNASHFDELAPFAVEPHQNHTCTSCGHLEYTSAPTISNPVVDILDQLYANAARAGLKKNALAP
jgi:transposase-like protein